MGLIFRSALPEELDWNIRAEDVALSLEAIKRCLLNMLGLFLSPCMEDGFNLRFHVCRGFRVIESPAILVIYLFPLLTV